MSQNKAAAQGSNPDTGERQPLARRPLSGDRPKETVSEDRLGYAGFAKALARSIKQASPRDGMVLAVHGPWGSGKTSAVNMTIDALISLETDDERTFVVRFNPWWFSEQENLTRAFFSEISAALGDKVSNNVQNGLKNIARRVGKGKDVVSGVLSLVPGGELAKTIGEIAFDALTQYGEEAKRTLDEERNILREALIEENKRILVVIDDVDRLPAEEARQLFRLVKSVADLPNIIYLMVFDREIARRAMGEAATIGGPEWLEKIVQASFDLPAAHPTDLLNLFTSELQEIVEGTKHNFDADRWPIVLHRCIAPWLRTARDVTRLSNAVTVSYPGMSEEVDLADFVAMESMRLFEPSVFELVRKNPDALCGTNNDESRRRTEDLAQKILQSSTFNQESLKYSLSELFPRLRGVWQNWDFSSGFLDEWDEAKRVCSIRRFPAYVTFSVGEDVFGESELQLLIASLKDKPTFDQLMSKYRSTRRRSGLSKAALAVDEIRVASENLTDDELEKALRTLLWGADDLLDVTDESDFFATPNQWRISYATDPMLQRLPKERRLQILEDMVQDSPALSFVAFTLTELASQHGLIEGQEAAPEDSRLVDEAGLQRLSEMGADRFEKSSRDGSLLKRPRILSLLYCWSRISNENIVRRWVNEIMKSDDHILTLMNNMLGVTKYGNGGVVKTAPRLNRDDAAMFIDFSLLEARILALKEGVNGSNSEAMAIIDRFEGAASARR